MNENIANLDIHVHGLKNVFLPLCVYVGVGVGDMCVCTDVSTFSIRLKKMVTTYRIC